MKFDRYAEEVSARVVDSPSARANRLSMYEKAYAPLKDEIRRAQRILDFGCGAGEFLEFLGRHATGERVGFDPSPGQLQAARERLADAKGITLFQEVGGIPPGGFDLIFSLHVIEHVPDDQLPEYVRALTGLLRPGGKVILATPNGLNPISYAYHMSGDRTHLRMHSPTSLAQLLVPEGYRIDGVHRETPQVYDFMTLLKTVVWWTSSIPLKLALLACVGGVRQQRLPLLMAPTFYVVASRTSEPGIARASGG